MDIWLILYLVGYVISLIAMLMLIKSKDFVEATLYSITATLVSTTWPLIVVGMILALFLRVSRHE